MASSIWTSPSRYGTCAATTKPVSESTVRRWAKESRTKNRKSSTLNRRKASVVSLRKKLIIQSQTEIPGQIEANNIDPWASSNILANFAR